METLHQGAEARVFKTPFFGQIAVVKERFKKKYRHPVLDEKLTVRRVKEEARNLQRCQRAGIRVPTVYAVDLTSNSIYMEFIEGETLKAFLRSHYTGQQSYDIPVESIAMTVGRILAKIHDLNLVHGDLTTSNMIIFNNDIIFIDFGLSYQSTMAEDKAVDLYVLERALSSTHPATEALLVGILESYSQESKNGVSVLRKLEDVRRRGRKRTMVG